MNSLLISANCPNCGGLIDLKEDEEYVKCNYCGVKLYVYGYDGWRRISYNMEIDKDRAISAVYDWFSRGYKARDLSKEAKIEEVYPIYVPFWKVNARVMGWVCGYKIEIVSDGRTVRRREVPVEKMIMKDYMWSMIACDPGDIGIRSLKNLHGRVQMVSDEGIPKFDVTVSREIAVKNCENELIKRAIKESEVDRVTFQKLFFFPRSIYEVSYPFWIVRYKYRDKGYFATVDGVVGRVVAGRAPGDNLWRSLAIAATSVLGGLAFSLLFTWTDLGIVGAIGGIILLLIGYAFFRHGSEIVEGDMPKKYLPEKLNIKLPLQR